jgi:hypothetical protein
MNNQVAAWARELDDRGWERVLMAGSSRVVLIEAAGFPVRGWWAASAEAPEVRG